jgi:quinol monooxygenase YgiN
MPKMVIFRYRRRLGPAYGLRSSPDEPSGNIIFKEEGPPVNDINSASAESNPLDAMTVLDPRDGYVTIVNTYVVDPARADELVSFLVDATRSTVRHVPGFISANFHVAHDRTHVVNYAQWRDLEALAAARENPELASLMQKQLRIAKSFSPVLYRLQASTSAA